MSRSRARGRGWAVVLVVASVGVAPCSHLARAGGGADGGAGKAGRIVRVERPRRQGGQSPRVCNVFPQSDMSTMCWGPPVRVGEEASVVSATGLVGRVRVKAVTAPDCATGTNYWTFQYDVIAGDLDQASSMLNALFDLEVRGDSGRSLDTSGITAPGTSTAENVWTAFDRDGDSIEDLIVTAYTCDAQGAAPAAGSTASAPFCLDYWLRDSHGWHRSRQDIIDRCY